MISMSQKTTTAPYSLLLDLPLVVWMIGVTIVIGIGGGLNAPEFISVFNKTWGYAIGEFALILFPSFVLAASLSGKDIEATSKIVVIASPIAGAGMVCPDTAYAALSPIAIKQRIAVAFGTFAGFKLLYPAGPLIVATGLGVTDPFLMVFGLVLLVPTWAIGIWWSKKVHTKALSLTQAIAPEIGRSYSIWTVVIPFALLVLLLLTGAFLELSAWPFLDFMTNVKGALILAAVFALLSVEPVKRRACLDNAIARTSSLLFIIGAASALGGVLTTIVSIEDFIPKGAGITGIVGLFILTAIFKLAQGSSMATFAAVAPIAAPIVAVSGLTPSAAVFAICLGSFVAILPNDSFYWLVRNNALNESSHFSTVVLLAVGSALQAVVGLLVLIGFSLIGVV